MTDIECGWCGRDVQLLLPTEEHPGMDEDGKPYAAPHPGEPRSDWGETITLDCLGSYRSITEHSY